MADAPPLDDAGAPSEFLAEIPQTTAGSQFLSALMRRDYAAALHYCRLILQHEPDNAAAQGFQPLLVHKLHQERATEKSTAPVSDERHSTDSEGTPLEESGFSGEAGSSQSSFELDSDEEVEVSTSNRLQLSGASSASASLSLSSRSGSAGAGRATDDNGNLSFAASASNDVYAGEEVDEENNSPQQQKEGADDESWSRLQELRARFTALK